MEKMVTHRSYVLSRGGENYFSGRSKHGPTAATAVLVLHLLEELVLAVNAYWALDQETFPVAAVAT